MCSCFAMFGYCGSTRWINRPSRTEDFRTTGPADAAGCRTGRVFPLRMELMGEVGLPGMTSPIGGADGNPTSDVWLVEIRLFFQGDTTIGCSAGDGPGAWSVLAVSGRTSPFDTGTKIRGLNKVSGNTLRCSSG